MKSKLTLGATGALIALIASSASAAVLVDYKMTAAGQGLATTLSVLPTSSDANVTIGGGAGGALVTQTGATASGSNNYNGGTDRVSNWSTVSATGSVSSSFNYSTAFTAGNYVTFSVTANTGYQITLDSITFQAGAATATTTTKRAFYLVSEILPTSFSNSSTILVSDSTPQTGAGNLGLPVQNSTTANSIPKDYSVSLTSLSVIGEGQTRYFRFYLQTETASQSIAFDDIVLSGTVSAVAVPEPSTFAALAGIGALGFVAMRRRRA